VSLGWLLAEAAEKKQFGKLGGGIVRTREGDIAGWFAQYISPRRISEVLFFAARRGAQALVMEHLLYDAARRGAVAASGRIDPALLPIVEGLQFCLRHQPPWTLVYSRHPEILRSIQRGESYLSRLDGEWWLSF